MAEILAVDDGDAAASVQQPLTTEGVSEVLRDLQLGLLKSDNGLEDDDEELSVELEEILKTCDGTQTKSGGEAESRDESVDDGMSISITNCYILILISWM